MNKRLLSGLLAFILGMTALPVLADSAKIVALVNGEIISSDDLQNRINAFLFTTKIPYNEQTKNIINQRVLTSAIDEKLKLQEAAKNDIHISQEELDDQTAVYEKKNNIPKGQLKMLLHGANVSEDTFLSQMKSDLAWVRLIRKKSFADGAVTQKEIDRAREEARKDLSTPKYMVSEIYIKKKNARNLNDLVANLRNDPRFELYAMQFSESASAASGGNLGWINVGKLPARLDQVLAKMKEGDISDPVVVGDGYYILRLMKKFDPKNDKPEIPDAKAIRLLLENDRMDSLSKRLLQDIRQRAVIEIRG